MTIALLSTFRHLSFVFLIDYTTTTMTICTSLVFYGYMENKEIETEIEK